MCDIEYLLTRQSFLQRQKPCLLLPHERQGMKKGYKKKYSLHDHQCNFFCPNPRPTFR
ncbi:hypothetical protein D3C86_821710 [compost metagenome]